MRTITNAAIKDIDSLAIKKIKRKLNDAGGSFYNILKFSITCVGKALPMYKM